MLCVLHRFLTRESQVHSLYYSGMLYHGAITDTAPIMRDSLSARTKGENTTVNTTEADRICEICFFLSFMRVLDPATEVFLGEKGIKMVAGRNVQKDITKDNMKINSIADKENLPHRLNTV